MGTYYLSPPLGFGFISLDWQPRQTQSGACDEKWEKARLPLLPHDFNRVFFNAAHPKLIAQGFLAGSEVIHIINASPQGKLSVTMLGNKPKIGIRFKQDVSTSLAVNLDTILVNTDDMKLTLLWCATQDVFNRIYDMEKIIAEDHKQVEQKISDDFELTV